MTHTVLFALFAAVRFAVPPELDCDVCVVGGGAAGIAAALQAGESGARTVLIEQGGMVGGNMTAGGVNFPGLFHAWGRQVIDGCAYRLLTNCVLSSGMKLPDFSMPADLSTWRHPRHQISFDIPLYVALAEEALDKAGVRLLYYTAPQTVVHGEKGWTVTAAALGERRVIHARQLVDATGNGSVASLAGGMRLRDERNAPGSFDYRLVVPTDVKVDADALRKAFDRAVAEGRMQKTDLRYDFESLLRTGGGINNYVPDADNSTAELRADTNRRGRASMLRMYRFLRSQPGLEGIRLDRMAPEVGVRETYRVEGDYVITGEDYVSGRVFDDAVCYAFYPIDLHDAEKGVKPRQLKPGTVATVPLSALRVKGVPDLWVAGRCISSDRLANSALRVEATCMATGQVVGEAAALAAKAGVSARKIDLGELRSRLVKSGAIVPAVEVVFRESFENGISEWKPFKRGRSFNPWKVESGVGCPVDVAKPPTSCLVWERKAGDPETVDLMRIIKVKPGQILKLTASALMETDPKGFTKGPNIAIGIGNAKRINLWKSSNRYAERNERNVHGWHVLELTTPAVPADADRIQIVCCVDGKSVGRFRYDDIEVRVTEVKTIDLFSTTATDWRGAEGRMQISGLVCVDPAKCAAKDLVVKLANGERVWPMTMDADNCARAVVDIADLPLGESTFTMSVSSGDGTLGAESVEHVFTRLPLSGAKRPKVYFDADRRMIVGGRPVYPLGVYWHDRGNRDDEAFRMLAESPFNLVVSYDKNMSRETMDRFAKCGKGVFVSFCRAYRFPREVRARSLPGITTEAEADEFVADKVKLLRDHPALLGWYIADELPTMMEPKLMERTRMIKALDPEHVTCQCLIGANGVREFAGCVDWIGMDFYPVGGLSASEEEKVHPRMRGFAELCLDARRQTSGLKPVWSVPQAFNWQGDYPNATYPWMRFPTFAECRAQAWLSIAERADGFCYFMFNCIYEAWKKGDRQPYEDLVRSVEEVRRLQEVLLSTEPAPEMTGATDAVSVRTIAHRGSVYVIVCNRTWQPVSGELRLAGSWSAASVEVGEPAALEGASKLVYSLPPIGVSVIRLDATTPNRN